MPDFEDKMIEAVARLIELTQAKTIIWSSSLPPSKASADEEVYIEAVFSAIYDGRPLRLYEEETRKRLNPLMVPFTAEHVFWTKAVILEIVDAKGKTVWTFPQVTPLSDLLEAVRYQVAEVDDFIEGLVNRRAYGPANP